MNYIIKKYKKDGIDGYLLSYKPQQGVGLSGTRESTVFMPETYIQTISHDEMNKIWNELANLTINCIFAIYKDNNDGNTYVFNKFSFENKKLTDRKENPNNPTFERKVINDTNTEVVIKSIGCTNLIKLISLTHDQFKPEYFQSNPTIPDAIKQYIVGVKSENENESQAGGKKLTWRTVKQYFTAKKHTSKTKKHRKTLKKTHQQKIKHKNESNFICQ